MKWNLLSFRRDIYGGLTAAVVAIPLALSFGLASAPGYMAASSGAISGAIFVGFFSALPGVTPSQNFRTNRTDDNGNGQSKTSIAQPLRWLLV